MTAVRGAWLALLASAFAGAALATEGPPRNLGQVHFSVAAEALVSSDRVVAVLYAERQSERLAPLTEALNKNMTAALDAARRAPGVESRTLDYRTNPVYRDRTRIAWRVRQALRLESADVVTLSKLIGRLQKDLAVQSIRYTLSAAARRRAEEGLVADVLAAFRRRAGRIAEALGGAYRIVRIDLGNGAPPVRPYPLRSAALMARGAAPPALQPGNQQVRLTATGSIEIVPAERAP